MKVEIEAPEEFAGALMGDLNGRRGRVQGMESKGSATVVKAEVPMAEMLTYGTTSDLDDAGSGQLPHGDGSLRCGAAAGGGEDPGHGEEAD